MERFGLRAEHIKTISCVAEYGLLVVALLQLSNFAFSFGAKREIIKRDGYKCVECGATENLEAAHYNHNKKEPGYDDPENGRMLCTSCHLNDHVLNQKNNGLPKRHNNWAIQTLKRRLAQQYVQLELPV